jgi:GNAT superfamily N-acetyltransferase
MASPAVSFVIRPPTAAEKRACRMLLPVATGANRKSELTVAVSPDNRVIGAAALGLDGRPEMHRGWQVDVRVITPFRRQGVGRALMDNVIARARSHGIQRVYGWEWVEPDSEAARMWSAFSFQPGQRRMEFIADLNQARATLLPLYERVVEEKWIPETARIIPLADANLDAVAQLHIEYLGGTRRILMPKLRGISPEAYDPKFSRVLMVDDQIRGFTLGRLFPGGVCEIDANVLHPSVRLGWANLWLKFEAARLLLDHGYDTIRYFTFSQHTDTHRVSKQVGARLVGTLVQMSRDITLTAGASAAAT